MRIVYARQAELHLASQFAYGVRRFGKRIAARTIRRLRSHIRDTIGTFPRAAKYIEDADVFETWVPGTPFVVFYRYDEAAQTILVLAIFHHAQDRSGYRP